MTTNSTYTPDQDRYDRLDYRRCGRSGLKLPPLSLGLWHNFGEHDDIAKARAMIVSAFDSGITHFDLANNYGPPPGSAEATFGKILQADLRPYRDELVITTKASHLMWEGPYGEWGSRKHLLASLDQSLDRLHLDYVDIFYAHRFDPETPLEETIGALISAVRQGKALYAGLSKFPARAVRDACRIFKREGVPCIVHQIKFNMIDREPAREALPIIEQEGLGCVAFSPLAQGLLTDRYLGGIPADSRAGGDSVFLDDQRVRQHATVIRELTQLADERGQKLTHMAIAWVLANPLITSAIIGASRPEQIADCLRALDNPTFTQEELLRIDRIASMP